MIASRDALQQRFQQLSAQLQGQPDIDKPDFWGGYRLSPEYYEFWQGGANRMHDRLRYRRDADNAVWRIERLMP